MVWIETHGMKLKDMDIGDSELEGIEKSCIVVQKGYGMHEQVVLLKEAIIKAREKNQLGVSI